MDLYSIKKAMEDALDAAGLEDLLDILDQREQEEQLEPMEDLARQFEPGIRQIVLTDIARELGTGAAVTFTHCAPELLAQQGGSRYVLRLEIRSEAFWADLRMIIYLWRDGIEVSVVYIKNLDALEAINRDVQQLLEKSLSGRDVYSDGAAIPYHKIFG